MPLMTDIHVRSFSGAALKPYLHSLVKLRAEVFRDSPYFEESDVHKDLAYLKKIVMCKEAIGVLIFDGTTLVGSALGYPMPLEESALVKPFKDHNLEINQIYFLGEPILLKHYRGRGIGHHFFDAREMHALYLKHYKQLCFCVPLCCDSPSHSHHEFISLHEFWRKRGYIHHPHLKYTLAKRKLDDALPAEETMSFWIKDLFLT